MKTCILLLLFAATACLAAQNPYGIDVGGRYTPMQMSREPLTVGRNSVALPEGRTILLDCDSYPRQVGKLVEGPALLRSDGGWTIRFAVDRFDDVSVRVVDSAGELMRTLGCALLGPNAEEPFQRNSLVQQLRWDGADNNGKPIPAGCKIEVGVGIRPRFDRFIGYRPDTLLDDLAGLEVDQKGRVYITLLTERRSEPVVLRFSREGKYQDMVYPCGPGSLGDRPLASLCPRMEMIDGKPTPTRLQVWPASIYRGIPPVPARGPWHFWFPLRIDERGSAVVSEMNCGGEGSNGRPDGRMMQRFFPIADLDHFWLMETFAIKPMDASFALDGRGFAYIASRTCDVWVNWPGPGNAVDKAAPGTIRKVSLATGQLANDFAWNGRERLDQNRGRLGTTQLLKNLADWRRLRAGEQPDAKVDGPSLFPDIVDLSVDREGRIFVVDGLPRRVKVYRADGFYLGEVGELALDGEPARLGDIRTVRAWGNSVWYVATMADDAKGATFLIKTDGDPAKPMVRWHVKLAPEARYVGVDNKATPPLVWVGNGGGPATLTRIEDMGDRAGDIRHVGGSPNRVLRSPFAIAADAERGRLYVHDFARGSIIRTDDTGADWQETPIHKRIDLASTFHSDVWKEVPASMYFDSARGRLLTVWRSSPPMRCFDRDLKPLEGLRLGPPRDGMNQPWSGKILQAPMLAIDRHGSLYVTDADYELPNVPRGTPCKSDTFYGVVRKHRPDGTVENNRLCRLFQAGGSIGVDSRGALYVFDLPRGDWELVVHNFPLPDYNGCLWPIPMTMTRSGVPVWPQSEICYLVKFGPEGGVRMSPEELWAHRGVSTHSGGSCACGFPSNLIAIDAADRIFAADHSRYHVKVFDTAGNLICRVGTWGNAETVPADGDASQVGFHNIHGLAAAGDSLYVSDQDLRRIAKFRMEYRELKTARMP